MHGDAMATDQCRTSQAREDVGIRGVTVCGHSFYIARWTTCHVCDELKPNAKGIWTFVEIKRNRQAPIGVVCLP